MTIAGPLLSVEDLGLSIRRPDGAMLPILADVGFDLARGETLGIVGESGSGKSLLALSLIALLPPTARVSGRIRFDGTDLNGLPEDRLCTFRGRRIAMIFQEPMSALNPAMRIGDQIAEGLALRGPNDRPLERGRARAEAVRLLDRVRLAQASSRFGAFPHELSGGQRQRVVIAIALARSPELLIADEPTTALDATTRRDILDLLAELVREDEMAMILVSHDLRVIAGNTDRTLVMYAGTRFEEAKTERLMEHPANPYSRALIAARPPRPATEAGSGGRRRFATIPGTVPAFGSLPSGCRFSPRCPLRIARCESGEPEWRSFSKDTGVRCLRADDPAQGHRSTEDEIASAHGRRDE